MQKILVVDDEEQVLSVIGKYLQGVYEVWSELHPQDALSRCRTVAPDAVLTDLYMSGMGGMGLISAFHEIHPNVPVVVMSGDEESADVAVLKEAGVKVEGALKKPFRPLELRRMMQNALDSRMA